MKQRDNSSAVRKVARALREACMAVEEGTLMGSEEDMLVRYNVSRPTFRQAAALLGQEQLLTIKRGVGGGYFACRPRTEAVAHTTAIFLQSKCVTLKEIFVAIHPVRVELARLAAQNRDEGLRGELQALLTSHQEQLYPSLARGIFDSGEYRAYLRSERDFARMLSKLANNTVLALFLDMLNEFCAMMSKAEDLYQRKPSRVPEYCVLRTRILAAILDGDPDVAGLHAERCGTALAQWLLDDIAHQSPEGASDLELAYTDDSENVAEGRRTRRKAAAST